MERTDAPKGWRERLWHIIFTTDTPAAKWFDIILLVAITLSVMAVCLESVKSFKAEFGGFLLAVEWGFTILFTIEYALRLTTARRPVRYARSFFGVIDLISILPTYISVLVPGAQSLIIIRVFRIVRIFRIFKLARFVGESEVLVEAMKAAREKIVVFIVGVTSFTVVIGALMYLVEGEESGFTSIPQGIYWAIVTLTTVGYGSIEPATPEGRVLASIVMIMGYGIIAVPTGIVTAELTRAKPLANPVARVMARQCTSCDEGSHEPDSLYCRKCGSALE